MSKRTVHGRRDFLRLSAVATGATVAAACAPTLTTTGPTGPAGTGATTELGTSGLRVGPLGSGTLATGAAPTSFSEAPELAQAVKDGKLPPVAERIGQDPLVIKPKDEVGKYGSTMRRAFNGQPTDWQNAIRFASGPDRLVYWDYEWETITPWLAKAYEASTDGRTIEIELRRGMKWSDGAPFTADDIMFWYEDIYQYREFVQSADPTLLINGKDVVIRRVDDFNVRFESPESNPLLLAQLASATNIGGQFNGGRFLMGGYAPKHYLSKFHPKFNPAEAEAQRAEGKFANVRALFVSRMNFSYNADLPVLGPWKVRKGNELTTQNWILERNPYYVGVDTAGNQLPYIGSLQHTAGNLEVVALRAVAGEYDFQDRHLDMAKIPLLKEHEDRAGYKLYLDPGLAAIGLRVNLNYTEDPEVGALLAAADGRRALSMAIQREQINEAFFLGAATPGSFAPPVSNKYSPGQESVDKWAQHDVAEANKLLDGLGYTEKNGDGFRLRKDGTGHLRLEIKPPATSFADFAGMGQMVRTHWQDVGIDAVVTPLAGAALVAQALGNLIQLSIHQLGSEDIFLYPDAAFPYNTNNYPGMNGIAFAQWFRSGGTQGTEPFSEMKELYELWDRGYSAADEERSRIGKEWWTKAADLCLQIGFVNGTLAVYGYHYAKNNMGNIPQRMINANTPTIPVNGTPQTFYYKT